MASTDDAGQGEGTSGALIVAAILVGLSLVMASFALTTAMDRNAQLISMSLQRTDFALKAGTRDVPVIEQPVLDASTRQTLNTAGSPARGPAKARVTVVEFADFQSPAAARATPMLRSIRKSYGDDVRIVFKHLPLPIHPRAQAAHHAAEAAHRQGKFWELHDKIFAAQAEMRTEKYREWASEIGLDMAQFERDLAAGEAKEKVATDLAEATKLGVARAPEFFVNGYLVSRANSFAELKTLIDRELAK